MLDQFEYFTKCHYCTDQDCSEIRNIVERYRYTNAFAKYSNVIVRACILLRRNDRFNVLSIAFLASKLLLTISRSGRQRIQSASTRVDTLWQRSKRIRGISRSRGGESQAWARSSDSFERVCWSYFFGACVLLSTDTPKYFNIEPAGLVQSLRALALSRRPPRMWEWIGMPLGFCTWVFIVRLSDDQWLSRDETTPTCRVHRLMKSTRER